MGTENGEVSEQTGSAVEPGMFGCAESGHPQNFSHRCADYEVGYEESVEKMASALSESMLRFRVANSHANADLCQEALDVWHRAKFLRWLETQAARTEVAP